MSTMSSLNISISISIRKRLMLMLMLRLSSLAHKLLMLMFMLMLVSLVRTGLEFASFDTIECVKHCHYDGKHDHLKIHPSFRYLVFLKMISFERIFDIVAQRFVIQCKYQNLGSKSSSSYL